MKTCTDTMTSLSLKTLISNTYLNATSTSLSSTNSYKILWLEIDITLYEFQFIVRENTDFQGVPQSQATDNP